MDQQQNFEYGDPSSFGFINSFSGSDNWSQGQQLNGKTPASSLPTQSFDPGENVTSQFATRTSPETFPSPLSTFASMQSDSSLTSQKESMFSVENPPAVVPANIIEPNNVASEVPPITITAPSEEIPLTDSAIQEPSSTQSENAPDAETGETSTVNISAQNNVMNALGVVRKAALVPATGSHKRRRRILQLAEDDSDEEIDLTNELQISPEKAEREKVDTEDSSPDSESDDDPSIANDPKALKARSLLKSAVIIKGPESKKKKSRVLESDEEDEMQTSVDDIGMLETNEIEQEDDELLDGIIVTSPVYEPIEAEILPETLLETKDEIVTPVTLTVEANEENTSNEAHSLPIVTTEQSVDSDEVHRNIKTESGDIDPAMSVEAILENIKPMADDDAFFKYNEKSDDSDVQIVPNEEYFGTPDTSKPQARSRKRGSHPRSHRSQNQSLVKRTRSNKYEKDFVDGSSESEDTSFSEPSSESSDSSVDEERTKPKLAVKKSPIIVQTKSFSVTHVPIRKKIAKKDRFYDKSRDIPNDVYFGDVKVPLHVLHTRWDSAQESSDSDDNRSSSYSKPGNSRFSNVPIISNSRPSYSYIEQPDDPKLSTLKDFTKMCGIKINYAKVFDGIRSTEQKCLQIRRILAQKGLMGEPTVAKCKKLRLELQAKRESAELDKSVILNTEGRTRRATRNTSSSSKSSSFSFPSTSNIVVQPETLQTLSKIRRVVDSDSE